jgi:putative transposase
VEAEMSTRKTYTAEFKREAVKLTQQPDVSVPQIAKELGISEYSLCKWRRLAREQGDLAFPGNGRVTLSDEQRENLFCQGVQMKYAFIKEHRGCWAVSLMADGQRVGRKRVARLMEAAGIKGKSKRRFKSTTNAKHKRPKADNLVKHNFSTPAPETLWASDITYVPTDEGWLYLAVILDLYSRKVIGWAFSDDLTLAALEMALRQRPDLAGRIHHSDKGVQYTSYDFQKSLAVPGIQQSMSGKGNCYDNAVVESFFATLKSEEVEDADYQTRQQAKTNIISFLETFYNPKRRHSSLSELPPMSSRGYTLQELLN